ncbi:MAG: hypothetical protein JST96_13910 [Bacteroidetes bacterium]|nr:hypothetical protein [Bacteroidota bacterium]
MKWNAITPARIFKLLFHFIAFIIFSIFILSCCQSSGDSKKIYGKKEPVAKNWIDIRIKFKENSSRIQRDSVIANIEKILVDTIEKMKKTVAPGLSTSFVLQYSPFKKEGSINYDLQVMALADTIKGPCTCKNNCQICAQISSFASTPGPGPVESITLVDLSEPLTQETHIDSLRK